MNNRLNWDAAGMWLGIGSMVASIAAVCVFVAIL